MEVGGDQRLADVVLGLTWLTIASTHMAASRVNMTTLLGNMWPCFMVVLPSSNRSLSINWCAYRQNRYSLGRV